MGNSAPLGKIHLLICPRRPPAGRFCHNPSMRFPVFLRTLALSCVLLSPMAHADPDKPAKPRTGPLASCVDKARHLIAELLPFAEQIAGKALDVKPPSNVVLFWISPSGAPTEQATAHVFGHSIQIHKAFCTKDDGVKAAILAHELGHIIEGETGQASPWITAEKWADRATEIRATRHALDIFYRGGRDIRAFRREYDPEHLEKAGLR